MIRSLIIYFLFLSSPVIGQYNPWISAKKIDSLQSVWNDLQQEDSIRLLAIDEISKELLKDKSRNVSQYSKLQYEFAKSIGNKKMMANALLYHGISYYRKGLYAKALEVFRMGLKVTQEIGDKKRSAEFIHKIGLIYSVKGNQDKAINLYTTSLKIRKEIGDKMGMAASLNNIGIIYNDQGEYDQAIIYYMKSLEIKQEIGDKLGIAASYNNIGLIYARKGDYLRAIEYLDKSIKIKEEIGDKQGIAYSLNNISVMFGNRGDYKRSLMYYNRSLKLLQELGDKKNIAILLNNIGSIYSELGDYTKAISYSSRALAIAQDIGVALETRDAAYNLYEFYKATGNKSEALKMFELHISTRDLIHNKQIQERVIRQEYKIKYEKKAAADSVLLAEEKKVTDAQIIAQQAKIKSEKILRFALYGGVMLLLLFAGFMYNRYRITQKQKIIIQSQKIKTEIQKEQIEEKHERIKASIAYAKRLQNAILPPDVIVKEYLKDSFILFKPKDVVAGDFYWVGKIKEKIFFAAADCTGHGVPGAMVSVMCNHALNRSVREYGLTDPGKILDKTRGIVVQEFENSEYEVTDGMDIALCSLDNNKLQYAGAHIPLWLVRNGEIFETGADEQPVGKFERSTPFTTHSIDLEKGDTLYILSDGYAAQFGGPKGKKFLAKQLKELIISIQNKSMTDQQIILDKAFEEWKGNGLQIDDVCMIGVRV